jgi:hypothetical protein
VSYWNRFWELIDVGLAKPDELERMIAVLPEPELVQFYWCYRDVAADLTKPEFTAHLEAPRTEDYVDDVAQWIVGRGLDYYEDIMMDPSKIAADLPAKVQPPPWLSIAERVYRQRYGTFVRFPDEPPPVEPS